MNRETFVAGMTVLASTFRQVLEDAALEGYWMALDDVWDDDFKAATRQALRQCKFMPAPAELRSLAKAARTDSALVEATDRKVAELRAWRERPPGHELEAMRETVRMLAEMKSLDEGKERS